MEKKYWLHRISHHGEVSYDLLKKGYLTVGWSRFLDQPDKLIETIKDKESGTDFRDYTEKRGITTKGRWSYGILEK